ncbi:MAG: deoxyribodipyrimidine photo-lyase [Bacteroidia bacterium]|nr:deoxyribodipyrimidine photo-lyase [Bacteroidia bacterium]
MTTILWFRRDLRLFDNAALYYALKQNTNVQPIFIFDKNILSKLTDVSDARITFIHQALQAMQLQLEAVGSSLRVFYDTPQNVFAQLVTEGNINAVYTNHDYEPYATEREALITNVLAPHNIAFNTYKDHVIFEKSEVTKDDGKPYTVFTPYANKWKKTITPFQLKEYPSKVYFNNLIKTPPHPLPTLQSMGFEKSTIPIPPIKWDENQIRNYTEQRNYPAVAGTTRLSVHLRFGTVSIRQLAKAAMPLNETWLNELIWRDFYATILHHYPHSAATAFKPAYDRITWRNNEQEFAAWCNGATGYPIVDAGMRELNTTGFMHNRVRMIVASFLTKHLLIDWRWGERYFAQKLLDFDLSANVGGWQWAAGSGCDAAPYFRVFSPMEQTKKFDGKLLYIKKWVPEVDNIIKYPKPIVEHKFARERVLATYKKALTEVE